MLGSFAAGRAVSGSRAIAAQARAAVATRVALRDRLQLALWILFPVAAVSAAWWTLQSDSTPMPELRAGFLVYSIAVPSAVGMLWWMRRPASGIGPLLVALGLSSWLLSWQSAKDPLAVSLGVAAAGLIAFQTFYLIMSFPAGRLTTQLERWVALLAAVVLGLAWLPVAFLSEGGRQLALCTPGCPPSLIDVGSNSPLAMRELFFAFSNIFVAGAVLAVVGAAYVTASAPRRRASLVVLVVSLFYLITSIAAYAAHLGSPPNEQLMMQLSLLQLTSRMVLPLGFLAALLHAEYYAAGAIRRLVEGLGSGVSIRRLRGVLAAAVGDPKLRIGVWDGGLRQYVDSDGSAFVWPSPGSGRAVLPIERNGQPIAAIVADEAVVAERDVRDAAATATVLAIEEQNVEGEVMALRVQAVAAADAERQRIVRDLHDSAQQRLVALRVRVSLLANQAGRLEADRAVSDRLAAELDQSIVELRSITRRFLPPSTIAAGVAPALRSLTTSWPIEITVHDRGVGRHAQATETAVFSCCVDAIRNAMEHGGRAVKVSVRLFERGGFLRFVVRDNGAGFDATDMPPGPGLTAMNDRIVVAGGCLSFVSAPGRGTVVIGTIPVGRTEA
jgi:signal transduction histidine kinase